MQTLGTSDYDSDRGRGNCTQYVSDVIPAPIVWGAILCMICIMGFRFRGADNMTRDNNV